MRLIALLSVVTCSRCVSTSNVRSRYDLVVKELANVTGFHYPESEEELAQWKKYEQSFPPTEDFVIGILVNPCGANGTHGRADDDVALRYDCCSGRFGQGEYAFRAGTRQIPVNDEPLHNIERVDENRNELDYRYSRRADDILLINESCMGLRDPHMACIADRFAAAKSKITPPCWDNNQTVDSILDCHTSSGKRKPHCMQVAYSQNAYIHVCGGEFAADNRCGTYLEVHKEYGTPYDAEAAILSDVKITTPVTNGMQTTTIPLTYKGDKNRILCSYYEAQIQVGSMVRVNTNAPSCCCPPKVGAFFCPKRQWSKDGGPFSPALKSLEEQYADEEFQQLIPQCPPLDEEEKDEIMCTQERVFAEEIPNSDPGRYFVRPCMPLVAGEDVSVYSSIDLNGIYRGKCPFFRGCGRAPSPAGCHQKDNHFTFNDEIGKVVYVPDDLAGKYGVSFNDGRSVYLFANSEIGLLQPDGTYQIWFVQRIRGQKKTVQKKKPFRVIWPRCTFDSVNDRYLPFAQLDNDGNPLA